MDVSGVGFLIHDIELSRGLWVLDKVILGWLNRERGVLPYPGAQNGAYYPVEKDCVVHGSQGLDAPVVLRGGRDRDVGGC